MSDCIFCKIVSGEIPSKKVYEDEYVLAFNDISPAAPVHIIIVPKKHIQSTNELNTENVEVVGRIFLAAKDIAEKLGISEKGYRIVNNCGEQGGQTVNHLHYHLLAGRNLTWPPG